MTTHRIAIKRKDNNSNRTIVAGYVEFGDARLDFDSQKVEDVIHGADLRFHNMGFAPELLLGRGDYSIEVPTLDQPLEIQMFQRATALSAPEALQHIHKAESRLRISITHERGQGRNPRLAIEATYDTICGNVVMLHDKRIETVAHVDEFFDVLPQAIEAYGIGSSDQQEHEEFRHSLKRIKVNGRTRSQIKQLIKAHKRRRNNKSITVQGVDHETLQSFIDLAKELDVHTLIDGGA